jgi:DNA gyrase subunit B
LINGFEPIGDVFYVEKTQDSVNVEIGLQYKRDDYSEKMLTFVNNVITPEGGTHLVGFKTALTRTINKYARAYEILKEKDVNLTNEDVVEGLTAIVSVKVPEPQFEGQTKAKLGNAEVRGIVDKIV